MRISDWSSDVCSSDLPRDSDGLPLGPLDPPPPHGPWDDCFTGLTWPIQLTWPGALALSLTSTCDHVVLYDQQLHAICVEPQSGPPDAANLGRAYPVRPAQPLLIETHPAWSIPRGRPPPKTPQPPPNRKTAREGQS